MLTVDGHDLDAIDEAMTAASDAAGEPADGHPGQDHQGPRVLRGREHATAGTASRSRPTWPSGPSPSSAACATSCCAARAGAGPPAGARRAAAGPAPSRAGRRRRRYEVGDKVATRKAYGDALVALGARDPRVVALDGEVSNSTYADEFAHAYPDRYFEMFIAEQQLVAAATGLAVRGYRPFASTFAAFLTRAYDFIRMGAISGVDLRLVGSHAGVEIGADGPSQMALEDLAMMRAVHGSTVLYPSDATSTAALVDAMAATGRHQLPAHHPRRLPGALPAGEKFPVGGSKVLRSSDGDQVTLVGAGVTLHECLRAADDLHARGHRRPGHRLLLGQAGRRRDAGRGRRGDRRADRRRRGPPPRRRPRLRRRRRAARRGSADLRLTHLAVRGMPGSGTGEELLAWAGIDADHIAAAARALLAG